MIRKIVMVAFTLALLLPALALAETPLDPVLPFLPGPTATKITAFFPVVFFGAHTIKTLWGDRGRKTIVGKWVFPVLDFLTGDTVKP